MEEPRIPIVIATIVIILCLSGFVLIGTKIYERGKSRARIVQGQRVRMILVAHTIDREILIDGPGKITIIAGVELEVQWVGLRNRKGQDMIPGTRLGFSAGGLSMAGLIATVHLKNGHQQSKSCMGSTVRFDYIKPSDIEWVRFSIPDLAHTRTRRRQR